MRISKAILPVLGVLLAVSGCASHSDSDSTDSSPTNHQSQEAAETPDVTDAPRTNNSTGPSSHASDSRTHDKAAAPSKVTVRVGTKTTTVKPTDVYCSGRPGHVRHIIGKTDHGLPLIKAEGTHFVMAKTGHGRPYKSGNPSGIHYGKDRVVFKKTRLGPATLNGTMVCTSWED
ncbi:hypothetical protein [Spelaeicoccus albus]|uniref:Lipoprotein n=1 Tax=Spelaeicoccus albus TaxID=1280376 RepID=A0A7Z0A910_9MICO|nr:hypothetical protein [Spelaeicoccus albus]NYI66542.1 hypothetical protein [Spelaeicoccus albus]